MFSKRPFDRQRGPPTHTGGVSPLIQAFFRSSAGVLASQHFGFRGVCGSRDSCPDAMRSRTTSIRRDSDGIAVHRRKLLWIGAHVRVWEIDLDKKLSATNVHLCKRFTWRRRSRAIWPHTQTAKSRWPRIRGSLTNGELGIGIAFCFIVPHLFAQKRLAAILLRLLAEWSTSIHCLNSMSQTNWSNWNRI